MGVVMPGDFKWFILGRYFTLTVFVLTRFHSTVAMVTVNTYPCSTGLQSTHCAVDLE